jgi:membrane protein
MDQPENNRGRTAAHPKQIPPTGWWDITMRVGRDLSRDNVSLIAAGLAMYGLLSVFPALTATVSLYGLLVSPAEAVREISSFARQMPPGVWQIFQSQLQDMARHPQGTMTVTAAVGIAVALWSARSGMSSLMTAVNVGYQEQERRSFIVQIALSLLFTVGAVLGFIIMLALTVAVPAALSALGAEPWMQIAAAVVRWALLYAFAVVGLAFVYRFAPSRQPARWHWITWGSAIAALLWIGATELFSVYIQNFASYQKTYGPLGDVVVLLMWFYLSSFFVVLGAEINGETERQTKRDTTTGPEQPLGQRGAFAADTVGPAADQLKH